MTKSMAYLAGFLHGLRHLYHQQIVAYDNEGQLALLMCSCGRRFYERRPRGGVNG